MDRPRFLIGLAGSGAAFVAPASARDQVSMTRLSVEYEHAGRPIARDFIGLSYESAVVAANDFFTADNRTLLRLLRTLGSEGVLRIGGNTSERASIAEEFAEQHDPDTTGSRVGNTPARWRL